MSEPTVSAGLARNLMEFAVSRGASRADLVKRSGIDPEILHDLDNRISFDAYVKLMRAGKALCNDTALAMHFAETIDMSEFSVVGLLADSAETMMESFAQLNRYGQLVIEVDVGAAGRFALEAKPEGLWLIDTRNNPNDFPELTESTFTRMVVGTHNRFADMPQFVKEVHVTHSAPPHRAEYERIFRCPVVFDSHWNAMLGELTLMTRKVALQPRYVFGILSAHAEQLLKDLESSKTTRGRVESLLMPIIHTGEVSMDTIAGKMAVSRQTLYRNLKEEGVTFEHVLDELRHKLALHYLSGKKVSVNETAYLVGFSDPAAFSRAFKRWTGVSPREVRMARAAE